MGGPLGKLADFPRASLGHLPTPLEALPNLGAETGRRLFVKRDDCSGLALGGNKVRQLEFYLGEALAQRADTVLITGAVQSNFVRLAAAAACKLGLACEVQLEERVPGKGETYRPCACRARARPTAAPATCCWTGCSAPGSTPIPRARTRPAPTGGSTRSRRR